MNGTDFGYYNISGGCTICKERCRDDPSCAGFECGGRRAGQRCNWWKNGVCGTSDKQTLDVTGQWTCMKYDKGNVSY